MRNIQSTTLRVITLSLSLVGACAIPAAVLAPDYAYAKGGNGNGNGNGGSNGNGNGNGGASSKAGGNGGGRGASSEARGNSRSDAARGSSNGKSRNASSGARSSGASRQSGNSGRATGQQRRGTEPTALAPVTSIAPAPRGNRLARELGVHPSELGSLNAANAFYNGNPQGAPNSQTGKLAAYIAAVGDGLENETALADALETLAGLSDPGVSSEDALLAYQEAQAKDMALQGYLDTLANDTATEDELAAAKDAIIALGYDPEDPASLDQASADSALAVAAAGATYDDALEYDAATASVEELGSEVSEQDAIEKALLEEAANKPVTDEIATAFEEWAKARLGAPE